MGHVTMLSRERRSGIMDMRMESNKRESKSRTLYNFYSAKTIYFARTPFKFFLIEKKNPSSSVQSVSLTSRNTVLIHKKTGISLPPEK